MIGTMDAYEDAWYKRFGSARVGRQWTARKKPLFDVISRYTKHGIRYKLMGSDIKANFSQSGSKSKEFLSQLFDVSKRWMTNHPTVTKLGIGVGLALLIYGITTRVVGGATLPKMREGYNEMQPGAYSQGIQRKQMKYNLTDFGSKVDLSDENTSTYVLENMTSESVRTTVVATQAIDRLVSMKGADNSHKPLHVGAAPTIRTRLLPRQPDSNLSDAAVGARRRALGISLALDSKPHLNAMFRASAVAGKGHRIRSADHAKAMNMTLNGA